jgi:hypothetical protein
LEYKYHKLVEGKSGSGELPAAETCGLDEDDMKPYETVDFRQKSKGSKLFGKLKSSLSKKVSVSQHPVPMASANTAILNHHDEGGLSSRQSRRPTFFFLIS